MVKEKLEENIPKMTSFQFRIATPGRDRLIFQNGFKDSVFILTLNSHGFSYLEEAHLLVPPEGEEEEAVGGRRGGRVF